MPKIVDREAKKKEIVNGAMSVFTKKGFANTRVGEIAEAAGISTGLVYVYFKDKNDVLKESFRQYFDMIDTKMGKRLLKVTDPVLKLKTFIMGWTEMFSGVGRDFIIILIEIWAEGIRSNHENGSEVIDAKELYADYRQLIAAILDEGIHQGKFKEMNTTLTASILIGALDGLMLQWIIDKTIFSYDEAVNHFIEEFMQGIILK